MIWAKNEFGERIKATPKSKAICPLCNEKLISKCGSIKIWHWAHQSDLNCDSWGEAETKWHLEWKENFPKEWQEAIIKNHRADIKTDKNLIIELQNSFISSEHIEEREKFYENMIWILNKNTIAKNLDLRLKPYGFSFRWKHPPKSWWYAKKQIYIDLNNGSLFLVKKLNANIPCGGWGKIISKEKFIKKLNGR